MALAALPVVGLAALNGFANLVLPGLLSRHPERLVVSWDGVWMWVPGRVSDLRGLRIEGHGPARRWSVTAERVVGDVALDALWERRLVLTDVDATGVTFRSRREPGPPRGERPWPLSVEGRARVARIDVDDVGWAGATVAAGWVRVGDDLEADLGASLAGGALRTGGEPVASGVTGELTARLEAWPTDRAATRADWERVSGRAALSADIDTMSFLAPWLERAPWLSVVGTGALRADLRLEHGVMTEGSAVDAETRDLTVRFQSYDIHGDGVVHAEVADLLGLPESRVEVRFGAFSIGEPAQPPLVTGTGFTVSGTSPDVSLAEPFDDVDVVLDLPEGTVPHLPTFDAFLPTDLGLHLTGGRASVRGTVRARTRDGLATGTAWLDADDVTARWGDLGLTLDLELRVPLREGRLDDHVYDFSGTRLRLVDLGIEEPAEERRAWWSTERDWWATITVPEGRALVGRREYLDARVTLEAADSSAFVRLLSQRKPLPDWVLEALGLPGVRGEGHLVLGTGALDLDPLSLGVGRHYEAGLRWHRHGTQNTGDLFAAWRSLSVGFRFDGDTRELVPFGARAWFAEGAPNAVAAGPAPGEDRRPVIRWTRKEKAKARRPGRDPGYVEGVEVP